MIATAKNAAPREYSLTPKPVARVETPFRRIVTSFPVPESIPILESLGAFEPRAMRGQPPVVWDRAEGFQVHDRWGNTWIDWSSGVLIANAGHGRREIIDAIKNQADAQLLANYCFPSEIRSRLVARLAGLLPAPLSKVFLLTTGSEAVEASIKLCRMHGMERGGKSKNIIVSYDKAFHGRTLGAQYAGGIPSLKAWIGDPDPTFVQVPFPDGFWTRDVSFDHFLKSLDTLGAKPERVAGVIMETYQGGSAAFAPVDYMRSLREWCDAHQVLLVLDEVQAGFGRTGTLWGFEHYGILPDLVTWGKGISSSLPLAAVAGRADVMDLPAPNTMTSTHTGSPVCCAAALASIDVLLSEDLSGNSRRMGEALHAGLQDLQRRYPQIGYIAGKGLVAGVACVRPGTAEPDGDLAWRIVEKSVERGVLMFSPVGYGGSTVKISPPLVITAGALEDSLSAFADAVCEAIG